MIGHVLINQGDGTDLIFGVETEVDYIAIWFPNGKRIHVEIIDDDINIWHYIDNNDEDPEIIWTEEI